MKAGSALLILTLLTFASMGGERAAAHGLGAQAFVEAGGLRIVATYDGGEEAHDVVYEVYDGQGRRMLNGESEGRGGFVLDYQQLMDVTIVIRDHGGHATVLAIPSPDSLRPMGVAASGQPLASSRTPSRLVRLPLVVSGLGYIAGLTGIAFFWLSRRERKRHAPGN